MEFQKNPKNNKSYNDIQFDPARSSFVFFTPFFESILWHLKVMILLLTLSLSLKENVTVFSEKRQRRTDQWSNKKITAISPSLIAELRQWTEIYTFEVISDTETIVRELGYETILILDYVMTLRV